jgi:hypothetical protein
MNLAPGIWLNKDGQTDFYVLDADIRIIGISQNAICTIARNVVTKQA